MSANHFFEHDDRGPSTSKPSYQRQNFPMGRHKDKKYRSPGGKSHMFDLDMVAGPPSNFDRRRFKPYGPPVNKTCCNRRKCKKNCKKHNNGAHTNTDHNHQAWYKVSVPNGRKLGKEFIMKSINSLIRESFKPYNFQFHKALAEFYVYGHSVAAQIKEVNRRITTPFGFKLILFLNNVNSPIPVIDPEVISVFKTAMSACYDPERHSLNLMKFHEMDTLKMNGLYVPINKSAVFHPVIKIIKENIPEIEILILSHNKLYNLEAMSVLVPVCKKLKSINLHNNKIRAMHELNYLKGLDLEELVIDGNPLCDDYKDKTSYIR